MEWISVKERKPSTTNVTNNARTSEPVLALSSGGYVGRCVFEVEDQNEENQWWFEIGIDVMEDVEYWMPCPKLPSEFSHGG
jgi:hypothetical protein